MDAPDAPIRPPGFRGASGSRHGREKRVRRVVASMIIRQANPSMLRSRARDEQAAAESCVVGLATDTAAGSGWLLDGVLPLPSGSPHD